MTEKELKCKNCGTKMNYDKESDVYVCPKCWSAKADEWHLTQKKSRQTGD